MKKLLTKVALFLAPVAVFAQEQASNWDFSALTSEISALKSSYHTFFTAALVPAAASIIACGVVLYVLGRAPRSVGLGKK